MRIYVLDGIILVCKRQLCVGVFALWEVLSGCGTLCLVIVPTTKNFAIRGLHWDAAFDIKYSLSYLIIIATCSNSLEELFDQMMGDATCSWLMKAMRTFSVLSMWVSHFSCDNLKILTSLLACKKDITANWLFTEVEVKRLHCSRDWFSSVGVSTTHLSQKHWSTWVKSHFTMISLQLTLSRM